MGLIFVLTAVNVRGVAFGALVQNIFTAGKLAALAVLVMAGLLVFNVTNLHPFVGDAGWGTTAAAAVPALLAFGGYNALAYIGEEVKNPSRNIPLGLVGGMAVVIGVYLLVNVVVIAGVPMTDLGQSSNALTLVATIAMGGIGGAIVAIGAMISIFGSLNGAIMAFPRLPFAMGRDKNLFGIFGDIHREYQTPYAAIIFHALLAMVYVLTSSFLTMLFMGVFISRLGEVLVVLSLAWLRRTMPNAERPVTMFAYPASAIIAAGLTLYLVACIAPMQILQGIGLILTAIPAYIFFSFWSRRAPRMRPAPAPNRSR
jgi:APA family basic amino acid/polyamine antiporter